MTPDAAGLRQATAEDAPRIARMHVTSWLETYQGIVPGVTPGSLSVDRRAVAWERILRDPIENDQTVVYLNETDGEITGFGACGAQRDADLRNRGFDGEIGAVYVLRAFQRQGIGSALMDAMANDLTDRAFKGVALWALRENEPARRFYEHCSGDVVAEKTAVRGQAVLLEVAYGWREIEVLRHRVRRHHVR